MRIHRLIPGTWARLLIWEEPTCGRATKLVRHNHCASTLEPVLPNKRSHHDERPTHNHCASTLEPVLPNKRSHHDERPTHRDWRVAPARRN